MARPEVTLRLWFMPWVGRLLQPDTLRPGLYWRSFPRIRLERKLIRELMPDAAMRGGTFALMGQGLLHCLN